MQTNLIACLLSFTFLVAPLLAADWPQWRGPNRDGVSKETGLLKEWPASGPKLLWQVKDLGDGYSTPSVVGNRLYVMSSTGIESAGNESVKALATADGKEIWSTRIGGVGVNIKGNNYPCSRSTPTVDGDRVYALGSDGDLACLETSTGKIIWKKNLQTDFGGKHGSWAYAESPLIDGDTLVCTPGGAEATLVALNKRSGAVIWKFAAAEADNAAYASIIVVTTGGVKQYVQLLDKGLVGVEAKAGKPLWRYEGIISRLPGIPTPVSRNDIVFASTGGGGGGLVQLKSSGAGVEASEIFRSNKLPTAIGGAVEVGGCLYGTTSGSLVCADYATGSEKWQSRGVGIGSLCYADGRLYLHGENPPGEVALVEATPEGYREKGKFTPSDGPTSRSAGEAAKSGKTWAYPVVANGRLYIRDWNCLWCYDIKAQ